MQQSIQHRDLTTCKVDYYWLLIANENLSPRFLKKDTGIGTDINKYINTETNVVFSKVCFIQQEKECLHVCTKQNQVSNCFCSHHKNAGHYQKPLDYLKGLS